MTPGKEVHLELNLGGERFRLQVEEAHEARILEIAGLVNQRLEELRRRADALTLQRAALMTAFQFAYEFAEIEEKGSLSGEEAALLANKIDQIISRIDKELDSADR